MGSATELQTQYYGPTEITLHVTILRRHAIPELDGKEPTELVTEHFLVFSPDDKHDQHFVYKYVLNQ